MSRLSSSRVSSARARRRSRMLPGLALLIGLGALITLGRADADDAALYGPQAPAGSAFVRVFNATDDADLQVRIGDELISDVASWEVSDFVFLPAGTHSLSSGARNQNLQLATGRYYTAVIGPDQVRVVDNDYTENRLKAQLILYNLTGAPALSLRTRDGATSVIDDVAQAGHGSRAVNPAAVQFALYRGEQHLADAPAVRLARGRVFSLFAVGTADAPRLVWAVN